MNSSFTVAAVTNQTPACVDDYSSNAAEMQTATDPYASKTESLPTSLAGELARLRYVLKSVFGWTQWYTHTDNVDFNTGSINEGAGHGRHVTAVGLHVWAGTTAPGAANSNRTWFPSITSTANHFAGIFWDSDGQHVAVATSRGRHKTGGDEVARWHIAGATVTPALTLQHVGTGQFMRIEAHANTTASARLVWPAVGPTNNQILRAHGDQSLAWEAMPSAASTVLSRHTSAVSVNNTSAETTVLSVPISAGQLGTNNVVRVTLLGQYNNASGAGTPDLTIRVKYTTAAATTFSSMTFLNIADGGGSARAVTVLVFLQAQSATTQTGYSRMWMGAANGINGQDDSTGPLGTRISADSTVGVDSSVAGWLQITAQHDAASASVTFQMDSALTELL